MLCGRRQTSLGRMAALLLSLVLQRLLRRGQPGAEIIVLCFGVRDLSNGFKILPVAGVNRVLRVLDGRKIIVGQKGHMQLLPFNPGGQVLDAWRRIVDFETCALLLVSERVLRSVGRSIT